MCCKYLLPLGALSFLALQLWKSQCDLRAASSRAPGVLGTLPWPSSSQPFPPSPPGQDRTPSDREAGAWTAPAPPPGAAPPTAVLAEPRGVGPVGPGLQGSAGRRGPGLGGAGQPGCGGAEDEGPPGSRQPGAPGRWRAGWAVRQRRGLGGVGLGVGTAGNLSRKLDLDGANSKEPAPGSTWDPGGKGRRWPRQGRGPGGRDLERLWRPDSQNSPSVGWLDRSRASDPPDPSLSGP